MVVSCWVKGCTNRRDSSIQRSFHSIPKVREHEGVKTKELSIERRRLWLANINRKDQPTDSSKICSDHFVTGKPADLYDKPNPDWAPTLNLTDTLTPSKSERKKQRVETDRKRYERAQERGIVKKKHHAARALLELASDPGPEFIATPLYDYCEDIPEPKPVCQFTLTGQLSDEHNADEEYVPDPINKSQVDSELQRLLSENRMLKCQLSEYRFNVESFENNTDKVKYFTGLPNYLVLMALFDLVKEHIPTPRHNTDLGKFERLIMTLMRLKLNMPVQYLAFRFRTSPATVSKTFLVIIHIMYCKLKKLIYWPEREELRMTMPLEFRKHFGQKTAVIIDCFEVFIQRPKNLLARAQTWSNYKHTNTVKFLIGITPQGSVSFLSKAWGGRASDKFITENCGLLSHLLPGDLVLADRGFDISDSVGMCCASVNIPAFTKGKSQLSALDVETTRKIASVRIHVERVIGLVRNKYTMLQDRLPIDFLMCTDGIPAVDKIGTVACALTNMCESVVPFN
ncbi:uncharacterized protein LOC132760059 [Ruditapes philippinarum]|uniref:uncharacterized protein LOC132760059 n=1 Tax=Ruditapes philippinarum TaxID=129788 RepID=UPI00295C0343|nr:uncharacterized protein LOC132760059 [Ruditapes philippinarum]